MRFHRHHNHRRNHTHHDHDYPRSSSAFESGLQRWRDWARARPAESWWFMAAGVLLGSIFL